MSGANFEPGCLSCGARGDCVIVSSGNDDDFADFTTDGDVTWRQPARDRPYACPGFVAGSDQAIPAYSSSGTPNHRSAEMSRGSILDTPHPVATKEIRCSGLAPRLNRIPNLVRLARRTSLHSSSVVGEARANQRKSGPIRDLPERASNRTNGHFAPPYPPPDTHCPPTGPDQAELHGLIGNRRNRARCGGTLGQHEERIDRDKGTDNGQCNCRNRAVRHVFPVPPKEAGRQVANGSMMPLWSISRSEGSE